MVAGEDDDGADGCLQNLKANVEKWQAYSESEKDKLVYQPNESNNAVMRAVKGVFNHMKADEI